MKIIFQVNAAIELLAGFILIFNPALLLNHPSPDIQGILTAKLYGILAFCFGIITFILSKHFAYTQLYKQIALTIIAFHFAVGLHFYAVYTQKVTPHAVASALHLFMAIVFAIIFFRQSSKFSAHEKPAA